MNVLVVHGPNLNLLGSREPEVYGRVTLDAINAMLEAEGRKLGVEVRAFQSNIEGELVNAIQDARGWADAIIINPAAYTHTSIAIPDAIKAVNLPAVEVHLSDINSREEFRKVSFTAPVCIATVAGKGFDSYLDAVEILLAWINGA